jgi:predicted DNA-binding transcriptional regulator AlpA
MIPDRLLNQRTVRDRCGGVSDMTIHRWRKAGILPEPVRINSRNFWPESVIRRLMKEGDRARAQSGDAA